MKIKLPVLLVLVTVCISLSGVRAIAHPWTGAQFAVVKLERQYYEALQSQNKALMESLLHQNFVIEGMDTPMYPSLNKDEFLATLPKQVISSYDIEHVKVEILGNIAKSTVNISMVKTYDGKDHSGDYEVYSVWAREGRTWKLLDRQIKLLSPQ